MSGNCLFDTNAVINILKGDQSLLAVAESAPVLYISVITVIEFLSFTNISESDKKLFEEFCERVEIIDITFHDHSFINDIIEIRKQYHIKTPDAIICASARLYNAELITADQQLLSVWNKLNP